MLLFPMFRLPISPQPLRPSVLSLRHLCQHGASPNSSFFFHSCVSAHARQCPQLHFFDGLASRFSGYSVAEGSSLMATAIFLPSVARQRTPVTNFFGIRIF